MTALFRIEDLSVATEKGSFNRPLVEDFNLEIGPNDIVGILGETGSGKSLSMKASIGLLPLGVYSPSGKVTFEAETPLPTNNQKSLRPHLGRGITLMLQHARGALNPFINVERQIGRVLRNRGVRRSRIRALVATLLKSVGLAADELGPRYAHEISGGQAQRVAMACALATNPRVLIADEPTTALDVHTELEVVELLKSLCHERQMGLIYITHNIALVSRICKNVLIMHAGHIVESGPVEEVFGRPLHPYTQGLIRTVPDVDRPHDLTPLNGTVWGGDRRKECCRYAHRCDRAWSLCRESIPPLFKQGTQSVRCFLYADSASAA